MNHSLATIALTIASVLAIPAMAQQAPPASAPAPGMSAPPDTEGSATQQQSKPSTTGHSSTMSSAQEHPRSNKHTKSHAKTQRDQNAATADTPSGAKDDSPEKAQKQ